MKQKNRQQPQNWLILLMAMIFLVAISGCKSEPPLPTSTPSPTSTPEPTTTPTRIFTPRPTATPTLPPLGEAGNPITIGFILSQNSSAGTSAEELTDLLRQRTNYEMETLLYPDFQSLSTAIMNGEVDLFWLNPLEYLYLNEQGYAIVMLMTNHQGVFSYGVQFIANINRGFTLHFDPHTGDTLGDMMSALQQFSGTRPCFTNSESIPGFIVPSGLLANTSTPTLDPVFTYNYNAVIRALYIGGICDFGVTYAYTGDPLTSSDILSNLPDAQSLINIVWRSDSLIPNLNLSASPNLPVFIRFRIGEAMLNIADSPDGLYLISNALNYQVEALRSVEDHFYNPLRSAILPLDLDLEALTLKTSLQ